MATWYPADVSAGHVVAWIREGRCLACGDVGPYVRISDSTGRPRKDGSRSTATRCERCAAERYPLPEPVRLAARRLAASEWNRRARGQAELLTVAPAPSARDPRPIDRGPACASCAGHTIRVGGWASSLCRGCNRPTVMCTCGRPVDWRTAMPERPEPAPPATGMMLSSHELAVLGIVAGSPFVGPSFGMTRGDGVPRSIRPSAAAV